MKVYEMKSRVDLSNINNPENCSGILDALRSELDRISSASLIAANEINLDHLGDVRFILSKSISLYKGRFATYDTKALLEESSYQELIRLIFSHICGSGPAKYRISFGTYKPNTQEGRLSSYTILAQNRSSLRKRRKYKITTEDIQEFRDLLDILKDIATEHSNMEIARKAAGIGNEKTLESLERARFKIIH